jgi:hypothetical protein
VATAYSHWQSCFVPVQLPHEQAAPLRAELIALGKNLDLGLRQARCLAEAALAPMPEAFENSGLAAKPRKRAARGLPLQESPEALPAEAPPESEPLVADSAEPSAAELADLASFSEFVPVEDSSQSLPTPEPAHATPAAEPPPAESIEELPAPEASPSPELKSAPKATGKRGRKKADSKSASSEPT